MGLASATSINAIGTKTALTAGTATVQPLSSIVSLQELNGSDGFISPNPTNGSLTINSKIALQKVEVIGLTGQILLSEIPTKASHTLHLDNFTNGIYFVNLYQNNRIVKRERVVLNK